MYLCVNGGAHGSQKSLVEALEWWVVGRCQWEWFWVCWKSRGALSTEPPLQHHMTTSSMYAAGESAVLMWVTLTGIVLSTFHRKIISMQTCEYGYTSVMLSIPAYFKFLVCRVFAVIIWRIGNVSFIRQSTFAKYWILDDIKCFTIFFLADFMNHTYFKYYFR